MSRQECPARVSTGKNDLFWDFTPQHWHMAEKLSKEYVSRFETTGYGNWYSYLDIFQCRKRKRSRNIENGEVTRAIFHAGFKSKLSWEHWNSFGQLNHQNTSSKAVIHLKKISLQPHGIVWKEKDDVCILLSGKSQTNNVIKEDG